MAVNLTVLMPVYNAASTIAAAARSILAEHLDGLELLVIDDGSTDGSAQVVRALGDPRIRVVSQPNAGLVAALNRGLDEARGEYLARMDADDLSVPGRLAAQLSWLRARPGAVMCGTDYEYFGAHGGRVHTPRSDRACRQQLLLTSAFCGASVVVRRSMIEAAQLRFDPAYVHAEDYEFFTRLVALGEVGNLPLVGYRYRIHAAQVSDRHRGEQRESHVRTAIAYAQRIGVRPTAREDLDNLLWPQRRGLLSTPGRTTLSGVRFLVRSPSVRTGKLVGGRISDAGRSVVAARLRRSALG